MLFQVKKRNFHTLWMFLVLAVVLSCCGGKNSTSNDLTRSAKSALHDWATQQNVPYEILEIKVSANKATWGKVDIVALIKDLDEGLRSRYVQIAIRLEKYGDEWRAETPLITDVFEVEILSAEDSSARECDSTLTRDPDMYPCLRITNRSSLRIKGTLSGALGRCMSMFADGRSITFKQNQHIDLVLSKKFFERNSCGDDWQERVFVQLDTGDHAPVVFYGSIISE